MRLLLLDGIVEMRSLFNSDLDPFLGFEGDQKLGVSDLVGLAALLKSDSSDGNTLADNASARLSILVDKVKSVPGLALVPDERVKLVFISASLLGYDDLIMRLTDAGLDETSIFASGEDTIRKFLKESIKPLIGNSGPMISMIVPKSLRWLF